MEGKKSKANSAGYFSTLFPPPSSVLGKDLSHSDLNWTLNQHKYQSNPRYPQSSSTGSKFQENPTRNQGSSLNYGGREFYPSTGSKQNSETPKNYKTNEVEYSGNTSAATRGEWWQGSLYY